MTQTGRRLNAGGNSHDGGLRDRSSGVQMDGGERLRGAGAHPRPFQQAAAARAAGDDGPELGSGGRSSGVLGFGVTRHDEVS